MDNDFSIPTIKTSSIHKNNENVTKIRPTSPEPPKTNLTNTRPVWVSDSSSSVCTNCLQLFSVTKRRVIYH